MVAGGSSSKPLRVVFFGTPAFAAPTLRTLLQSRHPVAGVVTQPDRARGRGQKVTLAPVKALALAHGLPILQPESLRNPSVDAAIREWQADLGVVAAYGKLIPDDLLNLPRHGMINVHASLLPRFRGAAPVHRAVIEGEAETGITIMRVVTALDAGGTFDRVTRRIDPDETSAQVERDLAEMGAALLVEVVERIASGTAVETPQADAFATYAPKITKADAPIDWHLPAGAIHNRVRGLHPWPHAQTSLDGVRLIVLRTRVLPSTTAAEPGTVVDVTRDAIVVAAGDGGRLAIEELQAEGRRPMSAREFLAGRPIHPGARLGP